MDDDGANDNSNHHTVQTNDDEEDDELLKSSGKTDNGEGGDSSWSDREITVDLLTLIAKKCTGKSYRKLGMKPFTFHDTALAYT